MNSKKIKGFSDVELLLVIATIALLNMLMVSYYSNYVRQAQMTEGLSLFTGARLHFFARILQQINQRLAQGGSLAEALAEHKILPKKLQHISRILEHSQQWDLFQELADRYRQTYLAKIPGHNKILEALLLIFVWLWVAILVIAIYLPIFEIGSII